MKRLLLVGGGHAHVEVLRRFAMRPEAGVAITLVTPARHAPYTGMLPGFIAGHYRWGDIHIDLQALAQRSATTLALTAVERIDASAHVAHCADGTRHSFDVCSIDVGSVPRMDVPGARAHALGVKPVERFVERWQSLLVELREGARSKVAVVGGGAGGVEILLAMQYAATAEHFGHRAAADGIGGPPAANGAIRGAGGERAATRGVPRFQLLTDAPHILPGHSANVRRIFERVLARRAVVVHSDARVDAVSAGALHCADGRSIDADLITWTISAAAAPWIATSGFATDDQGFLRVGRTLQSTSHAAVFGGGDAVAVQGMKLPKAGVFAVRQGPVLADNLRAALRGEPLQPFVSSARALNLISTGGRRAVMAWGGFALEGAWVWRWKDWIDRRFMRRYR